MLRPNETKVLLRSLWKKRIAVHASAPKTAFRIPIVDWLSGPLSEWTRVRFQTHASRLEALGFRRPGLERLVSATQDGDAEAASLCYAMLCLISWNQRRLEMAGQAMV